MADSFRARPTKTDWDASDLQRSADASDQVRVLLPSLDLGDRPIRHRRRWPRLTLEGVAISVAPDLIVRRMAGLPKVGAVKFRFGQTRPMADDEGQYAATLLRYYLAIQLKDQSQKVAPSLCQVVDAATGQVFQGKNAYKNEMKRIALACAEFRAQWLAADLDSRTRRAAEGDQPRTS